jgi:hypothetical protein
MCIIWTLNGGSRVCLSTSLIPNTAELILIVFVIRGLQKNLILMGFIFNVSPSLHDADIRMYPSRKCCID